MRQTPPKIPNKVYECSFNCFLKIKIKTKSTSIYGLPLHYLKVTVSPKPLLIKVKMNNTPDHQIKCTTKI